MTSSPLPPDALALELALDPAGGHVDWAAVFGRRAPVAIEIGTGNGWFLAAEAARLPDWNFLGIEREGEFYWKMVKRCARAGLRNVRALRADAIEFLTTRVPPASLARIYCYFSDPWPKRRHAHRRVVQPTFPAMIAPMLTPGAEFRFKTDVGWYFNFAVAAFRAHGAWTLCDCGPQPAEDAAGEGVSNYERRARAGGVAVWGFRAVYGGPPPNPLEFDPWSSLP